MEHNMLELQEKTHSSLRFYDDKHELLNVIKDRVIPTEVVMDIGPGIRPMQYFRPKLHFMVEPWDEYADILSYRHHNDKSVIVLRTGAIEALEIMSDASVDSIFLIDVIEHLTKKDGVTVLEHAKRVCRSQIIIFTPLGFMPQEAAHGETDAWGLSGGEVQKHLSGWSPDDFDESWEFYVCDRFHTTDAYENELDKPYGAFFAISNCKTKEIKEPSKFPNIQTKLYSEIQAENLTVEIGNLKVEAENLIVENEALKSKIESIQSKLANAKLTINKLEQTLNNTFKRRIYNLLKKFLS